MTTGRGLRGSFEIRRAHKADAAAVSGFAARLFRATYGDDTPASDLHSYIEKNFSTERQEAEIVDPFAAVFLAMADGQVVGYAHVILDGANGSAAFLNRIYVDAEWRGIGLADDLLEAVTGECRERDFASLELTVFERNSRALAFYKRIGFAATGTTTFVVGEDIQSDIVMALDLARPA
ncbi:GNAT family N-acetyltransferase [Neorhizobium sp. P12A]|uniref:GNAT family N-acetyltransferase n=1 Tax=Neorhizobium sp. P12A TaxID=2268027 RepID=UPI0011ECCB59|nr:GNAT family N-acetyltransferase [Neorhizobium sp. P12A]KAA0700354.1 GNAT family N-acetyltransferase [Neorhizobium sp. P12A]